MIFAAGSEFVSNGEERSRPEHRRLGSIEQEKRAPSPMAFTVDLGGGGLQIGEPIAKFVPKHRRNLSSSRASPDATKVR
jgi:hypothetical protein